MPWLLWQHWWLCWQWRRKPFGLSRTGQTGHLSFVEQGPAQMFLCIKAVDWHICEFLLAKTAGEIPNLFLQTAVLVHLYGPRLGISLMEWENASWEIEYWAERLTKIALKRRNQCSWKLIARPPWYQLGSALLEQTWRELSIWVKEALDKGLKGMKWLCFMSWMWVTGLGKGSVQAPLS